MASTKTRLRSIRRKANKHINKKNNTITVCAEDFFWVLTQIHISNNLEILEEQNQKLVDENNALRKALEVNE
ncbi:hypothetical protein [Psychrobacillus vulpis]|uniref:Uncharacterized protein n=1 Tax=Psychrobacillus vulpis TaxID=2325572 RepID=A0A544TWI5_9BACI|nr:hypothetical protein [Psychrobacillus vulpis]TQR21816.1 hypothetical protein FG384_02400 [Psychrobacillus vulpis]